MFICVRVSLERGTIRWIRPYGGATSTHFTSARNMKHALVARVVEIQHILRPDCKSVTAYEI